MNKLLVEGSDRGFLCIFGEHFSSLFLANDHVPFASRSSGMIPQIVEGDSIREMPQKVLVSGSGRKQCAIESAFY